MGICHQDGQSSEVGGHSTWVHERDVALRHVHCPQQYWLSHLIMIGTRMHAAPSAASADILQLYTAQ